MVNVSWVVNLPDEVTSSVGGLLSGENVEVVVGSVSASVSLCADSGSKQDEVSGHGDQQVGSRGLRAG